MGRFVDLAAFIRMLEECAPSHERWITNHRLMVKFNGAIVPMRRGPGFAGPDARNFRGVEEKAAKVRKAIRTLGISPSCVETHFPGLMPKKAVEHPSGE